MNNRVFTLEHHALAQSLLTTLRDKTTSPSVFANVAAQLGTILASDATQSLYINPRLVDTPVVTGAQGCQIVSPVLIPILRAGISLLHPFQQLLNTSPVGFAGVKRNAEHLAEFYSWSVPSVKGKPVFILDPMLASGSSAELVIKRVLEDEPLHITFISVISTKVGIDTVLNCHPDIRIHTVQIDPILNANKYIEPGLGDYGDRLFNTF